MTKLTAGCLAVTLTLLSVGSRAVEMNDEQRAELRERAAGLRAQRAQNPAWDGSTTRLNDSRGEVQLDRSRGDVKVDRPRGEVKPKSAGEVKPKRAGEAKAKRAKKQKAPREPVTKRVERTAKDSPGGVVRRR
ncbi:MAG TPA: hypothetical protein VFB75_06745 [Burkholderiales bacterium]|nr:hypothetical protein [Burkholderiales bacterium]